MGHLHNRVDIQMREIVASALLLLTLGASAQTYETKFARPVNDVMKDIAKRFGVRFKFDGNVDTAGVTLTCRLQDPSLFVGADAYQHL